MSSDIAIKIENLSKCYQIYDSPRDRLKQFVLPRIPGKSKQNYFQEFWALRDVSFEVKKGETVGIVGSNGSGKSTLLQMVCGTLNPSSGNIVTNGRIAALLELGSGFNPEFTGRENVYLNASVLGLTREETEACFNDIAAFADIGHFIDQPVKSYSSGMVVRLAFAVAINVEPEILVVDEALSVGDELFQRKCFSRIEAIKEAGATILFVSHSLPTITELCDRAILINRSYMISDGNPKMIAGIYQKILYASDTADIDQIIQEATVTFPSAIEHEKIDSEDGYNQESYYDPDFSSKSEISYVSNGARILSPEVCDARSKVLVNCLVSGENYRYKYKVYFDEDATNVRFGMLIKTMSGIELGGGVSANKPKDSIKFIPKGSTIDVVFDFKCLMGEGIYFLNAGVLGSDDQLMETYLHRVLDLYAIKVLPSCSPLMTGIVDFSCKFSLQ